MQINNISQNSFNGGFRFINMPTEARNKLPNIMNKGKTIFDNFEKKGEVFLIARDSYDGAIANFIKENKLNFEYYPSINTNLGILYKEERLTNALAKIKEPPIKTLAGLRECIEQRGVQSIYEKTPEHIKNILKTLCIDNKHPIQDYKGCNRIIDREFNRTIYISPASKFNMHYVKIQPNSKNQTAERYLMDQKGNVMARFKTPEQMLEFDKRFSALLNKQ